MVRPKGRLIREVIGLSLVACCLVLTMSGSAAIKLTPYLQAVTLDSVCVLVESDSRDPITADYGPTTAYGEKATTWRTESTTATPATYVHKLKLTGLKPNTIYNYRVSQAGAASGNFSFTTAAEPGTSYRFAWMADCRTQSAIHEEISGRIRGYNPRFSLYGGDLCERGYVYTEWRQQFFVPNQLALAASVPFFNTVGNHEGWDVNTKAFTQAPESSSGTQDYYSFDYGDAHFLCLNTEIPYGPESDQYRFAAKDLSNTKKTWKIVFFHKPAYSLGGNGEDARMKLMTSYVFEPAKVDLVLNGHNHFYQHNLVNGIHHFTIGTAGAPANAPGTGSYVVKAVFDYNYAIVDVTPTSLVLTAYSGKGTAIDRLSLAKSGPPDPAAGPIVMPTPPPPIPPIVTRFITKKATWKYSASGKVPAAAWKENTFSDRDWASGAGPFGFGESYITTTLPSGHQTYYFRKTISFSGDPSSMSKLTLYVNYDDGFVVYYDGQELARRGLPAGPIGHSTAAVGHEAGVYEAIDLNHLIPSLVKGVHVLAVEVHQDDPKSGDQVWDAELVSEREA